MNEKRGHQRDQDPTQMALEAASQALAAANAAVQAAFKALAISTSRRDDEDHRLERRSGSIRRAASQARRSAGGEASGDVPLSHPPAKARAKKPITPEATPGPALFTEPSAAEPPAEPGIQPRSPGQSAFAARKNGADEALGSPSRASDRRSLESEQEEPPPPPNEIWSTPENGVSHDGRLRPAPGAAPETTEPTESAELIASTEPTELTEPSLPEEQAISRPDGAGPIHLGPSTPAPFVEETAFPPPFVEDVVVPPPSAEDAPAVRQLDEVEVALHEAELHARELEMEAREAAMALYAPMEPPRSVPAKPPADLNGYTVLVVDDEEQVRALTVRILSRYGYHVLEASGVEIALTLLDEPTADVDLVLSDVAMPGLSGKDLFRAISESRPGLPVVFMSGYALGVYAPEGLVEEGVKMLPKPFTQEDLLEFVTEALEGPRRDEAEVMGNQ